MSNILSAFVYFLMYANILPIFPSFIIIDKYPIVSMITLAVFPMCAQLFCRHIFKSRFVRLLPTLLFAVSGICVLIEYLLMDYFRGWDVIGMMLQAMLLIPVAVGLALAWIIILIQKKTGSTAATSNVLPEESWEKDTHGLPDLFLFFFSALYCLASPILAYSPVGLGVDDILGAIFTWFITQFVIQIIFCYAFKRKLTKFFPLIQTFLLFTVFLILKARLGGNLKWEKDLMNGINYACICGAAGSAVGWIIYCIPWSKIFKIKIVRESD